MQESLPQEVVEELKKPLDDGLISFRDGPRNTRLAFIEGHAAIAQANRIFGFGNWGAELVGEITCREFRRMVRAKGQETGEIMPVTLYQATYRITVPGVLPRTATGIGIAENDSPEAHEMAIKGAEIDAIKRGLRYFGDQFGNGLYDKTNPQRREKAHQRPAAAKASAPQAAQDGQKPADPAPAVPPVASGHKPAASGQQQAAGTDPAPAPAEKGDRRLAQWAKARGVTSREHAGYQLLDYWLRVFYRASATGFATLAPEVRDTIMAKLEGAELRTLEVDLEHQQIRR
ncbi:MAG: hypothetical protein HY689_00320 [Chloroflexi bacterium]|nr:hypothetical protein [Chloroflexota bacterium]